MSKLQSTHTRATRSRLATFAAIATIATSFLPHRAAALTCSSIKSSRPLRMM
jgi:hypothetical protein